MQDLLPLSARVDGGALSLGGIANFTTATSTFYSSGGVNLASGCYAINGTCLSAAGLGGLTSVAADYPLTGSGTAGSHLSLAFGTSVASSYCT